MDQPLFPSRGESSGPETPSEGEGKVDSAHRLVQPRNPGYARRPGPDGSRVEAGEHSLRSEAAEPGRDQVRLGEAAASTPEAFLKALPPHPTARFLEAERRRPPRDNKRKRSWRPQTRAFLSHPRLAVPDGPLPRGRTPQAAQDDLHAVLRKERDARDPLPEMREHGAPPEGEGSPERVEDFDTARAGISAAGPPRFRGSFAPHSGSVLRTQPGKFRR